MRGPAIHRYGPRAVVALVVLFNLWALRAEATPAGRQEEAQAHVAGAPFQATRLLELASTEEALTHEHTEPLAVVTVPVGVEAHGVSDQPAAGLADGTAHCGSGGATNRPSATRSP